LARHLSTLIESFKKLDIQFLLFGSAFISVPFFWAKLSSIDSNGGAANKKEKLTCHRVNQKPIPENKSMYLEGSEHNAT